MAGDGLHLNPSNYPSNKLLFQAHNLYKIKERNSALIFQLQCQLHTIFFKDKNSTITTSTTSSSNQTSASLQEDIATLHSHNSHLQLRIKAIKQSQLTHHSKHTSFLKSSHQLKAIGVVKSQFNQNLHCSSSQGQNYYTTSPACLARLYFSSTYLIARFVFIWPVQTSILEIIVRIQWKISKLATLLVTVDNVGRFYENEWKKNPFLDTSFFFLTKNPNDPDFDLILDFSNETHPF